jgi:hypothetical protein
MLVFPNFQGLHCFVCYAKVACCIRIDVGLDHRALVRSVIVHDWCTFSGSSVHSQTVNTLMSDEPLKLDQSCTISDMSHV